MTSDLLGYDEQNQNEGNVLGWSEAYLKLGVETFDPLKFGNNSKSNGVSGQFLIGHMTLGVGNGFTRFELEVPTKSLTWFRKYLLLYIN